jgi:hypothetical protein
MATASTASLASLEQPKQELVVFRNSHESSSMYTPKGTRVIFVAGKYATQDPEIIAFLAMTLWPSFALNSMLNLLLILPASLLN